MAGKKKVGILALQGAFKEHQEIFKKLNCNTILIRKKEQLNELDGLIIPGGESTTIIKLMTEYKFIDEIKSMANKGMGIWGTCAGLIILASEIANSNQESLKLIDIKVERNAFGRQIDSFENDLLISKLGDKPFPAVFIRAPWIIEANKDVEILAEYKGKAVLAKQNKILVSSFHPELTDDLRLHEYFINSL
ncbi:pyridoxal 5'-phosphate synthase glutaminase subunit PdxT [Natronospora cellulosivora (SeqCode)]